MAPSPAPNPGPPKLPLVILGLLTLATMLGPIVIFMTIRGGPRPEWPPDRPIEWAVLVGVCTLVVALMAGCLTSGLWAVKKTSESGEGHPR